MYQLGKSFDAGDVIAPASLTTAVTGKRVMARNAQNVNFLIHVGAAGTGTEDLILKLQQFTASSSGTSAALVVDHVWVKAAAALAGTETWTKVANAATDGTITLPGATYAADELLIVAEINTKDLTDGFDYVGLTMPNTTLSNARVGSATAVLSDLTIRRSPANMAPTLF
jgi:hypothetical protein